LRLQHQCMPSETIVMGQSRNQDYPGIPDFVEKRVKKGVHGGSKRGQKGVLFGPQKAPKTPLFVTPFLDIFRVERISHGTLQRTCEKNVIMCVAQQTKKRIIARYSLGGVESNDTFFS